MITDEPHRGPTPPELTSGPKWSAGEPGDDGRTYLPIPLIGIQVDSVLHFDVLIRTGPRKFVKYRDSHEIITGAMLTRLSDFNHEFIFIPVDNRAEYNSYIEQILPQFIANPKIPITQKATLVYNTTANVIQELLDSPRGDTLVRSDRMVDVLVDLVSAGTEELGSILALASYDYYTYTHSVNVSVFSIALANKLRMDIKEELKTLAMAAILHDVGKTFLPREILSKPRSLSRDEFMTVKEHPSLGQKIVMQESNDYWEIGQIVRQHHERVDGSGYPDGLGKAEIHPMAKIITVTDMYDALTTRRVYRGAFAPIQALKIISELVGHSIEERIFREFVKMLGTIGPT